MKPKRATYSLDKLGKAKEMVGRLPEEYAGKRDYAKNMEDILSVDQYCTESLNQWAFNGKLVREEYISACTELYGSETGKTLRKKYRNMLLCLQNEIKGIYCSIMAGEVNYIKDGEVYNTSGRIK